MGFRSTFVTEDYSIAWPQWFRDKYGASIHFPASGSGAISSAHEEKCYGLLGDLPEDIQKAIDWKDFSLSFVVVFLHECGGVTRCQIERDSIKWSEPEGWTQTSGVTHNYCYGCSDA